MIPNLQLKLGLPCLPEGRIERLTAVSHHVAEVLNRPLNPQAPYVGASAFAHKAGLHVSAIARAKDAYEHVDPELVGNGTRFVVSEMAGRATIQIKADELGLPIDGPAVNQVIDDLKRLEHEGYHFEAADASLELLMRRAAGWEQEFFRVESMRVITDELPSGDFTTEATVKVWVGDGSSSVTCTPPRATARSTPSTRRCGPRSARHYPQLAKVHLTDYKVRILDGATATGAVTRVLIDATNGERIVDDDRRQRQHHRGVVAGARGEPRLRPAPHSGHPLPALKATRRVFGGRKVSMAAPKFAPVSPDRRARVYESPDIVPGIVEAGSSRRPRRVPAGGRAARLPGSRPGLRDEAGQGVPRPAAAAARRARRRRGPGLPRHRPAAGFDVQPGAGRPRPDDRVHDLGLPRPQAARRV